MESGINYNKVNFVFMFCKYCCLDIMLQGEKKIIVMLIQRSPNSLEENDQLLLGLMEEISGRDEGNLHNLSGRFYFATNKLGKLHHQHWNK